MATNEIIDSFRTVDGDVIRVDRDGTLMVADSDGALTYVFLTRSELDRLLRALSQMVPGDGSQL